jgi:hypothetical protein
MVIDPDSYTSLRIHINDGGSLSSLIESVTVYYTIEDGSSNYLEWSSFELNSMARGGYYNVFPNEQLGLVGFPQGVTVTVKIIVTDFNGNSAEIDFTLTVSAEDSTLYLGSQIMMAIAGAIVIGSLIYRFLRRKKVKVIDRG